MAFSSVGFATIGASKKGNAPSIYSYSTTDTIATVNTEGYFNDLSDTLAAGDVIFVRSSTGGTQVLTIVYVLTNASGVVDVNDGTTLANTDGD
jgi:hypothetical protein|tara:strand:- start:372 stop:650 length:279 start_codon:yes stop_codon:yes gene_type:complete